MKNPILEDREELIRLYEQYKSVRKVADILSINRTTVTQAYHKLGISVLSKGEWSSQYHVKKQETKTQAEGDNSQQTHKPKEEQKEIKEAVKAEKEIIRREREKRLTAQLLRQASLNEMINESLREAIVPQDYKPYLQIYFNHGQSTEEEIAVCIISDTQIGKVTSNYNSKEFAIRLQTLAYSIVKIVELHRKNYTINKLVILKAGDIVDGESIYPGHAFGIDQAVINQVYRVGIPAFIEFYQYLSTHFTEIEVICVPGNHGRNSKHGASVTNWDRVLYWSLQYALQNYKNIHWNLADDDKFYVLTEINGYKFLTVHGEQIKIHLKTPYYGINHAVDQWIQSIPGGPFHYVAMGHLHQSSILKSNKVKVYINGAFTTNDMYVLENLKQDTSEPTQWLFGVHKQRGISWRYEIDLLKKYG